MSFRPLSGKWGYRFVSSASDSRGGEQVSVPSRGNGVIDLAFPACPGAANDGVSVPSRGNGVIDLTTQMETPIFACFRPLSGKWGYRYITKIGIGEYRNGFRPLSGKWGYRFVDIQKNMERVAKKVSVPSRGNGVIDSEAFTRTETVSEAVSVPSRGNGVIDHENVGAEVLYQPRFRPLSGKWGYRSRALLFALFSAVSFRPLSGKWGYR